MKEQSLFMKFLGDAPYTRVLDYLLTERDLDFSITDIAKNSKISRSTLYRIWDNLIKNKIIIKLITTIIKITICCVVNSPRFFIIILFLFF